MIYVSSSCVKTNNLEEAVEILVSHGISNIELSGGTIYDKYIVEKLKKLQESYKLNFLAHNYFPPPKEDLVLNMASLDNNIFNKSMEHYKRAIDLSVLLCADSYAIHAGFYINIAIDQLGKCIRKSEFFNKKKATERFCKGFNELQEFSSDVELYIENNVFSDANHKEYPESNPFMLTCYDEYKELRQLIDFNLLLDVAHLKVSAHTLGLNFEAELSNMAKESNYWHLSDNNQLADENRRFNNKFLMNLQKLPNRPKKATIEIYEDISIVSESYQEVKEILF